MVDIDLQTVLNAGTINSIFLGGTTGNDKVTKYSELALVDAKVTHNENDIVTLDSGINVVNTRLDNLEDNFPTDGHFYLPGVNPHMTMFMMSGSNEAVMDIQQQGAANPLASMSYDTTFGTFFMSLNDEVSGNALTSFVLVNDGTCQVNSETVATQEWHNKKNFYRYFKMHSAATINTDTWTEVARLQEYDVPGGIVEYALAMTFRYDTTSRSAMFRFSTDGGSNWSYWNKEVKDTTDDNLFYYAYPSENAAMSDVTLIVEAKCEGASDNLLVKFLNLTLDRKADY